MMETWHYPKAAIYSLVAYIFLAAGMVCFKLLTANYPLGQILAAECLICLPFYLALAQFQGGLANLKTHYPAKQLLRGLLQTGAALFGFWALVRLPLSTVTMLSYVAPLIITLLAFLFLKEKCPPKNMFIIFIGLISVAIIAQPESGSILAVLAQILSSLFWAANVLMMRTMPNDKSITFPFYTVLTGSVIWPIQTLWIGYVPFFPIDLFYAASAGLLCFTGAQLLFSSYRLAPFYFTTPFQYTQLIWVVLAGWLIWSDVPTFVQITGVSILILANLWLVFSKKEEGAA